MPLTHEEMIEEWRQLLRRQEELFKDFDNPAIDFEELAKIYFENAEDLRSRF
jgi:hypothetical protein